MFTLDFVCKYVLVGFLQKYYLTQKIMRRMLLRRNASTHCPTKTRQFVNAHDLLPFFYIWFRHQLETPGQYNQLSAFYEDKKATLSGLGELKNRLSVSDSSETGQVAPLSTPVQDFTRMKVKIFRILYIL